jgi:hypothetical protein
MVLNFSFNKKRFYLTKSIAYVIDKTYEHIQEFLISVPDILTDVFHGFPQVLHSHIGYSCET